MLLCVAPSSAHVDSSHSDIIGSWTRINSLEEITGDGNYYLAKDLTLTETWTVPSGKKINLCLDGHVIQQTVEDKSVIKISGSRTQLNICDCSDKMHYFDKNSNGLWILNDAKTGSLYNVTGGVITGGKVTSTNGGGVFITGGKFTLSGGNIVGNSAKSNGGGVYNGGDFTLSGGNVVGNYANYGGGLYSDNVFTMSNGKIMNNKADDSGGGVYIYTGSIFTMTGGNIMSNTVRYHDGAGVYSSGTFTMVSGNISGNSAKSNGGGVCSSGTFTMESGCIIGNSAHYGGGVDNGGTFTMVSGNILNNSAGHSGGGVENDGTFTMESGCIIGNSAHYGGGVDNGGTFTMESGSIAGNTANEGGGVTSWDTFTMDSGSITGNIARDYGGGVQNRDTFIMNGGSISNNTVSNIGGGVYNRGTFTMFDGSISDNTASSNGGGVYHRGGTLTMESGSITDNTAENNGGGVYSVGTLTMNSGSISDNTASSNGGGVYVSDGTFTMSNGNIASNSAGNYGGGVYSAKSVTMSGGNIIDNTAESNGGNVYNIAAFTMSGGADIDDINLAYYNDKQGLIRIIGSEFTGGATYITKKGMQIGDVIVEIDKSSTVSAKDIAGKFSLANEMMILGASEDNTKLVVEARVPKFHGATLLLSNDIAVRFSVLDASLVGCNNPYINVKFNGTEYNNIRPADDAANKMKTFTFRNISPAEMNETVVAELYATRNGESSPTLFETREYSIKTYCDRQIAGHGVKNAMTTLCVDLLNYGSALQAYRGEDDVSKYSNYTLTTEQRNWASTTVNPAVSENDFSISESGDDSVGIWRAASLILYSDISISCKFTTDVDASDLEAVVRYGDGRKEIATVKNFADSTYSKGDCKVLKFNKMSASMLNYPIEITLRNKVTGAESKTLTYSVDAYAYSNRNTGGELGELITSIMKYIRSVNNYVNR